MPADLPRTEDHVADPPTTESLGQTTDHSEKPAEEPAPVAIPGYEILGKLGEGGMGVVYRAKHIPLSRIVALKMVLGSGRADSKSMIRFLAEAESVAAITHPNVVRIFDYGQADNRPYMALEFLAGGSLGERLEGGKTITPIAAATLLEKLARGMQAAHERGIVHRDLKPANVLFDENNEPKITDFGLAKRGEDSGLTLTGSIMGTPAYMAPEQAKGDTKFAGPSSDIWALGVILYECLTGHRPFQGSSAWNLLRSIIDTVPKAPRQINPALPRDLAHICMKCMEKAPNDRYFSAEALADDLGRFLRKEPIAARPAGAIERSMKWVRRKPALAAAWGFLLLTLIVGGLGGFAFWLWKTTDRALENEKTALIETKEARQREKGLANELADQKYIRQVDLALRDWQDNLVLRSLTELIDADPKRRQWEWRYVANLCAAETLKVELPRYATGISLSPDGALAAVTVDDHIIRVVETRTAKERLAYRKHKRLPGKAAVFHPNGKWVISCGLDGQIHIWDVTTGETVRQMESKPGEAARLSLCPDGSLLAVGIANTGIQFFTTNDGKPAGEIADPGQRQTQLTFSADGSRLYATSYDLKQSGALPGWLRIWDPKNGKKIAETRFARSGPYSVRVSPDGKQVVTGDEGGSIRFWSADKLEPLGDIQAHESRIWSIDFSSDGKRMLTASLDQTARIWDVKSRKLERSFRGHVNDVMDAAWIPGRAQFVSVGDTTLRVWDANRNQEARVLVGPGDMEGISFSADGKRIAGVAQTGLVVWDVATGVTLFSLPRGKGTYRAVAMTPDGTAVVVGGTNGAVRIWPVDGGEPQEFAKVKAPIFDLALSPEAQSIAIACIDGSVSCFNSADGKLRWTVPAHQKGPAMSAAFSPDGRLLATAGEDRIVRLWSVADGKMAAEMPGHTGAVMRARFSPKGDVVASVSIDNTTPLWSVATGKPLYEPLKGHVHYVDGVAFSPDGARVVDASGDRTLKIYDTRNGQELLTLKGHTEWVTCAAFSPDGSILASCARDGTVRLWEAPLNAKAEMPKKAADSFDPDD